MTRDEAAKIVRDTSLMDGPAGDYALRKKWSETMVDTLAALGLLKLEEPRGSLDILKSRLVCDYGYNYRFKDIERALEEAGLQVVAK